MTIRALSPGRWANFSLIVFAVLSYYGAAVMPGLHSGYEGAGQPLSVPGEPSDQSEAPLPHNELDCSACRVLSNATFPHAEIAVPFAAVDAISVVEQVASFHQDGRSTQLRARAPPILL